MFVCCGSDAVQLKWKYQVSYHPPTQEQGEKKESKAIR